LARPLQLVSAATAVTTNVVATTVAVAGAAPTAAAEEVVFNAGEAPNYMLLIGRAAATDVLPTKAADLQRSHCHAEGQHRKLEVYNET